MLSSWNNNNNNNNNDNTVGIRLLQTSIDASVMMRTAKVCSEMLLSTVDSVYVQEPWITIVTSNSVKVFRDNTFVTEFNNIKACKHIVTYYRMTDEDIFAIAIFTRSHIHCWILQDNIVTYEYEPFPFAYNVDCYCSLGLAPPSSSCSVIRMYIIQGIERIALDLGQDIQIKVIPLTQILTRSPPLLYCASTNYIFIIDEVEFVA